MEESKELQKLYGFMQAFIYITVCIEILLFVHFPFSEQIMPLLSKMAKIPIYSNILYFLDNLLLFHKLLSQPLSRNNNDSVRTCLSACLCLDCDVKQGSSTTAPCRMGGRQTSPLRGWWHLSIQWYLLLFQFS